jgi:hypothetical protein
MAKPSFKRFQEVVQKSAGNMTKIAKAFGVYRSTVYRWMDDDDRFREEVEEQRGRLVDKCLASAQLLALGMLAFDEEGVAIGWKERPDGQMLRYLLGTFGHREGFTNDVRLSGKIEYDKLTDRQLDAMVKGVVSNIRSNIEKEE